MIAKNQILKIVIRPDVQNCHPQIMWSFSPIQVKTVLLDNQEEVLDDDVAWPDGGPESRPAMRSRLAGSVFGPCTRRAPLHVLVQMKCEFHQSKRIRPDCRPAFFVFHRKTKLCHCSGCFFWFGSR